MSGVSALDDRRCGRPGRRDRRSCLGWPVGV